VRKQTLEANAQRVRSRSLRVKRQAQAANTLRTLLTFSYAPTGSTEFKTAIERLPYGLAVLTHGSGIDSSDTLQLKDGGEDVVRLRHQLRVSFERFFKTSSGEVRYWTVPSDEFPLQLTEIEVIQGKGTFFLTSTGPWPIGFWFPVATLLSKTMHLLRRCADPDCGHAFVRTRRQMFCSKACGQRVRSANASALGAGTTCIVRKRPNANIGRTSTRNAEDTPRQRSRDDHAAVLCNGLQRKA
jgi:hypothetical protein